MWDAAVVQTCIVHLIRNTFRYAARAGTGTGSSRTSAGLHRADREPRPRSGSPSSPSKWGAQYPAIVRLWENAWAEFVPFLDYDVEIRRVICTTNAIESINARYRRAVRGPRALPDRAGRAEMPLPGHQIPGPDRQRSGTLGDEVEARTERVRDHLRRPDHSDWQLTDARIRSTVYLTAPPMD